MCRFSSPSSSSAGHCIKAVAVYDRPWWRESGWSGQVVHWNDDSPDRAPIIVAFDVSNADASIASIGTFIAPQDAAAYGALPRHERRQRFTHTLREMFDGDDRAVDACIGYFDADWAANRWHGGCPVDIFPVGALTAEPQPCLSEPMGRLHFASTDTADAFRGYMEGALQAGERAAREVAHVLNG